MQLLLLTTGFVQAEAQSRTPWVYWGEGMLSKKNRMVQRPSPRIMTSGGLQGKTYNHGGLLLILIPTNQGIHTGLAATEAATEGAPEEAAETVAESEDVGAAKEVAEAAAEADTFVGTVFHYNQCMFACLLVCWYPAPRNGSRMKANH
jgi:hypothetical protein